MRYPNYLKRTLLSAIDELADTPSLYACNPGRDFTRNRKLNFKQFLILLLSMEGDCIKEELYRFFGRSTAAPSKAAFYKQRQKLQKDALRNLLFTFNSKLKRKLFKDKYQLIACDGSALDIYRNPDDPDTFFGPSGKSSRGFNQIHVNAFFSILDSRFTDLVIQPGRKRNEYSSFCQMVDAADQNAPKSIYICDMGYASYNSFAHVIENDQYFLIRCNDVRTESILGHSLDGAKELDAHVNRILSRSQSKKNRSRPDCADQYRFVCKSVDMDYLSDAKPEYELSLRIVRIELSNGCFENLITNLPDLEFDIESFKALYHLRWTEENAFRDMKYPLCLKAFHSKKYDYIVQEVWARAILYNFCADIANHVTIPKRSRKHVYKANFSHAAKTCREFLRIRDGSSIDVEALIVSNIEPIRDGRIYRRQHRFKLPISFCYRY